MKKKIYFLYDDCGNNKNDADLDEIENYCNN